MATKLINANAFPIHLPGPRGGAKIFQSGQTTTEKFFERYVYRTGLTRVEEDVYMIGGKLTKSAKPPVVGPNLPARDNSAALERIDNVRNSEGLNLEIASHPQFKTQPPVSNGGGEKPPTVNPVETMIDTGAKPQTVVQEAIKQPVKPKCEVCGKVFETAHGLKIHSSKHEN